MQLSYTQGLIRGQTDPTRLVKLFLQKSGLTVSIYVTDQPLQAAVAHKSKNYIINEPTNVSAAWTIPAGAACWLYWDINRVTGNTTRGTTVVLPASGITDPFDHFSALNIEPLTDQHYFNKTTKQHFVYDRMTLVWTEVIRVFAGSIDAAGAITAMPFASQVGLVGSYTAGYIIFSLAGLPFVEADGTFLNTGAGYMLKTGPNNALQVDIGNEPLFAIAASPIPALTLISPAPGGAGLYIAADGPSSRFALGLSTNAAIIGSVLKIQTSGIVRSDALGFLAADIGKTIWLGPNGVLLVARPDNYASQVVGTVLGIDSFLLSTGNVGPTGTAGQIGPVGPVGPAGAGTAGGSAVPTWGCAESKVIDFLPNGYASIGSFGFVSPNLSHRVGGVNNIALPAYTQNGMLFSASNSFTYTGAPGNVLCYFEWNILSTLTPAMTGIPTTVVIFEVNDLTGDTLQVVLSGSSDTGGNAMSIYFNAGDGTVTPKRYDVIIGFLVVKLMTDFTCY
jgi:hypothetical protein